MTMTLTMHKAVSVDVRYMESIKNRNLIIRILSALVAFLVVTMVNASVAIVLQSGTPSFVDQIIGPFGALALSLAGIYILLKFIRFLLTRNDALQSEIKQMKDEIIKAKEEVIAMKDAEIKRLRQTG